MESTQKSKLESVRAQSLLDRDIQMSELRSRLEGETSRAMNKVMESLRAENTEHLRLHRATVENELKQGAHFFPSFPFPFPFLFFF